MKLSNKTRKFLIIVGGGLMFATLSHFVYFAITWWGHFRPYRDERVVLKYNPVEEWRVEYRTHAESERAWIILEQLASNRGRWALDDDSPLHSALAMGPRDPEWMACKAWLAERRDVFARIREAAKRPVMGYDFPSQDQNPPRMLAPHAYLNVCRQTARLLRADSFLAAEEGDFARVAENVVALCRLSALVSTNHDAFGILVGQAVHSVAVQVASSNVTQLPDYSLESVENALGVNISADPTLAANLLRDDARDVTQRIFSDKGDGTGGICADGISFLQAMSDNASQWTRSRWAMPLLRIKIDRASAERTNERMIAALDEWARTPAWDRGLPTAIRATANQLPQEMQIFAAACAVWESYTTFVTASDRASSLQIAAITAVKAERFKRTTGSYPQSLEAALAETSIPVPLDRMSGDPLRWRVAPTGIVIYSVGPDLIDDGAASSMVPKWSATSGFEAPRNSDDVLWPMPE